MWFAESPWFTIVTLATFVAVGLSIWVNNRRTALLIGIIVCLVLMPVVWYAERLIVTPREQVEQSIYDITAAFQQKDEPATLGLVSARAKLLRATVSGAIRVVDVDPDMRVTDIEIELSNQNSRAVSRFRVNATVSSVLLSASQHYPSRWEATWQREAGQWKML
ncbi:MAG: hypothetical protein KDA58_03070 [Planctomycetaceae bacterium]|nr:hypothetical protein [Planctomycetaceae bacterium]